MISIAVLLSGTFEVSLSQSESGAIRHLKSKCVKVLDTTSEASQVARLCSRTDTTTDLNQGFSGKLD